MNRYVVDTKGHDTRIESNSLVCDKCSKKLKEKDWHYFGSGDKKLYCEDCTKTGKTPDFSNPNGYYHAELRKVKT